MVKINQNVIKRSSIAKRVVTRTFYLIWSKIKFAVVQNAIPSINHSKKWVFEFFSPLLLNALVCFYQLYFSNIDESAKLDLNSTLTCIKSHLYPNIVFRFRFHAVFLAMQFRMIKLTFEKKSKSNEILQIQNTKQKSVPFFNQNTRMETINNNKPEFKLHRLHISSHLHRNSTQEKSNYFI